MDRETARHPTTPLAPPQAIDLPGADLLFHPHTGLTEDGRLLERLIEQTPWRSEHVTVFGKTYRQPRLVAWYGDHGASYTYSGTTHEPLPWTPDLSRLRRAVESLCGGAFNSVLLNYYRDGADAMGLHADDEPELGPRPLIASLSLGAPRRMYFRHRSRRDEDTLSLDLPDGSLLLMSGTTQEHWKHGIRRTARPCGPRVNLTYRYIVHAG